MSRFFKFFSLLGVMLIGLSTLVGAGTSVYAAEKVNEVPDIETQRQQAVESLKFYLEEAGYVDTETHQYIVTDLEAIQKKAELDGSEGIAGKFILENFVQPTGKRQKRDLQKYAACVVMNSLPFGVLFGIYLIVKI